MKINCTSSECVMTLSPWRRVGSEKVKPQPKLAACQPRYHIQPNLNIIKGQKDLKGYEYLKENNKQNYKFMDFMGI